MCAAACPARNPARNRLTASAVRRLRASDAGSAGGPAPRNVHGRAGAADGHHRAGCHEHGPRSASRTPTRSKKSRCGCAVCWWLSCRSATRTASCAASSATGTSARRPDPPAGNMASVTAASLVEKAPITIGVNDPVEDVTRMMAEQRVWLLPVVDGQRLVGVIHYDNVAGTPPDAGCPPSGWSRRRRWSRDRPPVGGARARLATRLRVRACSARCARLGRAGSAATSARVSSSSPTGTPSPVQASQPGPARYAPLLPEVMSRNPSATPRRRRRRRSRVGASRTGAPATGPSGRATRPRAGTPRWSRRTPASDRRPAPGTRSADRRCGDVGHARGPAGRPGWDTRPWSARSAAPNTSLTPPPVAPAPTPLFHTTSELTTPVAGSASSRVPPQARACGLDAGKSVCTVPSVAPSELPSSPAAAVTVTPSAAASVRAWSKAVRACAVQSSSL